MLIISLGKTLLSLSYSMMGRVLIICFKVYDIRVDNIRRGRGWERRWREGLTVVDNLTFRSFFYTTSVHRAIQYLATRQNETEVRWSEEPMTSDDD